MKNMIFSSSSRTASEICFRNVESTHGSPDEHVKEVDECEFDEGGEDGHEAHDDKDIQGGGIGNLNCIKRSFMQNLSNKILPLSDI